MYARILVALDGSELAERILPHVEALSRSLGSTLIVLRATTPTDTIVTELNGGAMLPAVAKRPRKCGGGEQTGHYQPDQQESDAECVGIEVAGEPGRAEPCPPDGDQQERRLDQPGAVRMLQEIVSELGHREDGDQIKEQLDERHVLASTVPRPK